MLREGLPSTIIKEPRDLSDSAGEQMVFFVFDGKMPFTKLIRYGLGTMAMDPTMA